MSGHVGDRGWGKRLGAVFQEEAPRPSAQRVLAAHFWTEPDIQRSNTATVTVLSFHPNFGSGQTPAP